MTHMHSRFALLAVALLVTLSAGCALATTKGLNQILTPDIQPAGVLSLSYQGQSSQIGNSEQAQFELGLSKSIEVAVFRGFGYAVLSWNVQAW